MSKIVILGAGVMGSAFSMPLTDNGHQVNLVGTHLDDNEIEEIHESGVHPRLKTKLNAGVTPFTYDRLGEALEGADLVVAGVNSLGIDWAADILSDKLPDDVPMLFLTKGLHGDNHKIQILPHRFQEQLPANLSKKIKLNAVGGPSIAGELAANRHTCVVVTGPDQPLLDKLAGMLRTPYYHVWTSTDMVGVETCVAMKNVYALAVGLVNGMLEKEGKHDNGAIMFNVAAGLFAQGLWEISYMVEVMGGRQESVYSLPGAGDLYVTSMGGRNQKMGRYLAMGVPYSEAKRKYMPSDTVEGAELSLAIGPTVEHMVAKGDLDGARIPLLRTMIQIVCNDEPAKIPWDSFFQGYSR